MPCTTASQLQATQQIQQDTAAKASEREQALQQQLPAARLESASRLQANQALSQLLERSTQALADAEAEAEAKNYQLYSLGQDLVKRWQGRSQLDTAMLQDSVLGLVAVRFEDQAEKLHAELEAKRLAR